MGFSKEEIEELKLHFVPREECNDIQKETAASFANDDKRISLILADLNLFKKFGWVIATATVGQLVATLIEGFSKL